jgi:hypothetical protein
LRVGFPSFTPNGSDTYTTSFYVRLISGNTSGSNILTTDLADGSPSGNYLPLLIPNQWVRVSFSAVPTATAKGFIDLLSDNTNNYVLDFWGVQVELGRFPTSYIPTSGSTVTRTADNVSIVGTNFRKWYNPLESTILSVAKYDGNPLVGVNNAITFFIGGPTGNTWQGWWETPNTGATLNFNGSTFDATIFQSGTTLSIGNTLRMISALRTNDFAFCRNGGPIQSDTTVSLRTEHNAFFIGSSGGGNYINGRISQIVYYPTRLPNQILQTLTK